MKKEKLSGGLIPSDIKKDLVKDRHLKNISFLSANGNKWFYIALLSIVANIGQQIGWHRADKRFAENVQVAWVKMQPNGVTDIEIADKEKPVDFFMNTVESKLSEWTEKRFSKRKATIKTDYGFARLMMSPELQTDFMDNYKAAEVAAKLMACAECQEVETKVREVQMLDKDKIESTRNSQLYTSLIFITEQTKSKEGRIMSCENKIITVLWKFRPVADIVNKRDELKYNPLGQDIVRYDPKRDPTPVDLNACKAL